jgi:hypothetical protein
MMSVPSQAESMNSNDDELTNPATGLPDSAPNLEMQRLFLECLNKQKSHEAPNPSDRTRSTGRHLGELFRPIFAATRSTVSDLSGSAFGFVFSMLAAVFKSKIGWASMFVLAVAALSPVILPLIFDLFLTRSVIHARLAETFAQVKDLRENDVTPEAWTAMQQRSQKTLDEVLPKLARTASSSDPASLSLLWIARDYLPRILAKKEVAPADIETKIQYHLKRIKSDIAFSEAQSQPWDISTVAIVTVDVLGMCAAIAYFRRSWWNR